MDQFLSIGLRSFSGFFQKRFSQSTRKTKALKKYFGFVLLIVCSAGMGLFLQFNLPYVDPLSSIIDSSIWVVICYSLTSFLIFHLLSFRITHVLLDNVRFYFQTSLKEKSWSGYLVFLGVYFLLLYGFLLCLILWL